MRKYVRRSISIPEELDVKLAFMLKKYSYSTKNDLLVELIELGLIKFNDDIELKSMINVLLSKINELLVQLDE